MTETEVKVTLTVIEGEDEGLSVDLTKPRTTIGRRGTDLLLTDKKVSTRHAAIEIVGSTVTISDTESRNGVFVNGKQASDSPLKNLDEVQIGFTKLKVLIVENLDSFRTHNLGPGELDERTRKRTDIGSMIDNELKRASKLDVSSPRRERSTGVAKYAYGLEVIKGPDEGKRITIEKETTILGRGKVDLPLRDRDVSRLHAAIEIKSRGKVIIRDLGSTNGTYVNRKKITEATLSTNDRIQIGSTLCRLVLGN